MLLKVLKSYVIKIVVFIFMAFFLFKDTQNELFYPQNDELPIHVFIVYIYGFSILCLSLIHLEYILV